MGKKLDALLGRSSFKAAKFKSLTRLAISRISILKNQRQARYSTAKSDVVHLLKLGHHDRALLRVEHVIKDQNMLDAFVMMEDYLHLLLERVVLLQRNRECPDELKEVISSLIFASSRCGEFPELHEIRGVFETRFGKEVAARAIELRNNCGVNPKIIQKLSVRQPSLENRLKVLKGIANENGIVLQLEEDAPVVEQDKLEVTNKQKQQESNKSGKLDNTKSTDEAYVLPEESNPEKMSESLRARRKYRDVATAAREAFESAAYAAAAARAAVELSRSESRENDQDHDGSSRHSKATMYDSDGSLTPKPLSGGYEALEEMKHSEDILKLDKIHPTDNIRSESEGEDIEEQYSRMNLKELERSKKEPWIDRTFSTSSSDSEGDISGEGELLDSLTQKLSVGNQMVSYGNHKQVEMEQVSTPSTMHNDLDSYDKPRLLRKEHQHQHMRQNNAVQEEDGLDEFGTEFPFKSPNWVPLNSHADPTLNSMEESSKLKSTHSANSAEQFDSQHSRVVKKHLSMRTRRARWD